MRVTAYDPGVNFTAQAIFEDKKLIAVSYSLTSDILEAARAGAFLSDTIIERPVWWKGHPRPQDLMDLSFVAGGLAAISEMPKFVTSLQWGGTVPKEIRVKRIQSILSVEEVEIFDTEMRVQKILKSKQHNAWDAVGIGLFATGRAGRGMVPA